MTNVHLKILFNNVTIFPKKIYLRSIYEKIPDYFNLDLFVMRYLI